MSTVQVGLEVHRILYATDFSAVAETAGRYAAGLAQSLGAPLEIGHVLPTPNDERDDHWPAERKRREKRLTEYSESLGRLGVQAHSSVSTECPASLAISLMQRRTGADLVVVGTDAKTPLDRLLLGSTAEALLREGTVPVLVVGPHAKPPKEKGPMFATIVLATDFSATTENASRFALSLAVTLGAHLCVVHTVQGENTGESNPVQGEAAFKREIAEALPVGRYGFYDVPGGRKDKEIGESIVQFAGSVGADLIVMGAREPSFWLLHVRRGVTQDVLAEAGCPVLTVR